MMSEKYKESVEICRKGKEYAETKARETFLNKHLDFEQKVLLKGLIFDAFMRGWEIGKEI